MTKAEARISRHILLGWSDTKIAKELGINIVTVKRHLQNVYNKVGCSSRIEFIKFALNRADLLQQIYGV